MAVPRRRNHFDNRFRNLIPVVSFVSGVILIILAVLSFLTPYPVDSDNFPNSLNLNRAQSSVQINISVDDPIGPTLERVPSHWERSDRDLWTSRNSKFFHGCSNASSKFLKAEVVTHPNRYLVIATSGGLNQQRTGIIDGVVAARILNATLVVPKLDQKSFWKDASNFPQIFDVDWFISSLAKDVKIIKELPRKRGKTVSLYSMRIRRKCNEKCYINHVLPVLLKRHVVQLSKFDYRVSNKLDNELQKLRCRVNYHALKFTDPIREMGEKLVHRMRMRSKHFIALHLRFESDMLAFSGCYYGGGDKERKELGSIRKMWKNLRTSNPDKERRRGKCPLSPEDVGLMLRALGYGNDVHIYVASGDVYGGEATLAPLKALFPNFYSKETLATKEELQPFASFSSRMAALDFLVCDESDVFVTNNNGNMAKMLAGRRRYFNHKPTIRPNAKKLYRLFLSRHNTTWEAFASRVRTFQRGFMGEPNEVRAGRGEFHENPSTCICEDPASKEKRESGSRKHGKSDDNTRKEEEAVDDDHNVDEDPEWPDGEDEDEQSSLQDNRPVDGVVGGSDYDTVNTEEPELEDMLSD